MALLPVLTVDSQLADLVRDVLPEDRPSVRAGSWERLLWLVRERPATSVVLDCASLPAPGPDESVADLRRRFPSLGVVLVSRPETDRVMLLRLGRAAIAHLELLERDDVSRGLVRALARSRAGGARAFVLRAMAGRIPRIEYEVVRAALDGALLGWRADDLADRAGWTRAHLSVRLRDCGLPSAGRLLLWTRLLHAARWLEEPGRSAESVSRQLDYANGPAFRRALRNYVAATPTQVRKGGGIRWMLDKFLDVCGLGDSVGADLSVA